ncbi:MAG: Asparagine synthase [Syntrophorhabdus sp. PtaB.Bin027]|nr:MAG: Asparagine synthase [Syntrophorhabdus sp. PtaB.Bin027]
MLIKLNKGEFFKTRDFGCFCPYWIKNSDGEIFISDCFNEIISLLPDDKRIIDPVGVASLLQFNWISGNRTLVSGINRLPWRGQISHTGELVRRSAIPHGNVIMEPKEIAQKFETLLIKELESYIINHQKIHLLLSGGLDSRIIAGLLKKIEPNHSFEIKCVTWGIEHSRDVVYAKKIAELYDWDLIHIPLNSSVLKDNIFESCKYCGAEIAGIHLHGAKWFEKLNKKNLVLAASFGDSIGRGEFNGQNLNNIKMNTFKNRYGIIRHDLFNSLTVNLTEDRNCAFIKTQDTHNWALCELDLQENYMRRMIVPAMGYIGQWTNLEQMFISTEIVQFIWSLNPTCRNNKIYQELFKVIDPKLNMIPWARNGISFNGDIEKNLKLTKNFHDYPKWCKNDLNPLIEKYCNPKKLSMLNIFNLNVVNKLFDYWTKNYPINYELILKIAQIGLLSEMYDIKGITNSYIVDTSMRSKIFYKLSIDIKNHLQFETLKWWKTLNGSGGY